MGALKKFEKIFKESTEDQVSNKEQINDYLKKIDDLLIDPEKQKKAAQIISDLMKK